DEPIESPQPVSSSPPVLSPDEPPDAPPPINPLELGDGRVVYLRADTAPAPARVDAYGRLFGYGPTYFPGASAGSAQPVTIGPAETREDIDIRVGLVELSRVAGRVSFGGEPVKSGVLFLLPTLVGDRRVTSEGYEAHLADGAFVFPFVPPGQYSLEVDATI